VEEVVESTAKKVGNGFTYSDYVRWPDDQRWEIIAGEAYAMTPAPSIKHQKISHVIDTVFGQFFKDLGCQPFHAPTDVVFDDQNVVQPDLLVVCDKSKITENNIQGAPDLVVEILLPSTAVKDKREKKALYERFGVREYLIVYPAEELVERLLLSDGRYGSPEVFGWDEVLPVAIFPELSLNLWEFFERQAPQRETKEG
jgi:Uma2 family endonuclease